MNRTCLTLSLLAACGCAAQTDGRIVHVQVAVQSESEPERAPGSFETRTGWEVTLDRAELALSAIYAFAPAQEPSVMARLSRALVPVAHAHGGHDPLTGKRVRAELLDPLVVDLLDAELRDLAEIEAEAGSVAALAVDIAAPSSPITDDLDGHQVWVSGEAQRGDVLVRFTGGLRIPDRALTRRVETQVEDGALDEGDTLVLGVHARTWFDLAEFDRLEPAADDEPRTITPESQVGRAWFIGARSPAALSTRIVAQEDARD